MTYGVGTASGKQLADGALQQAEGVVVDGGDGARLVLLDDVDLHLASRTALRTCARTDATVSPTMMRRLTPAVAREAMTFSAASRTAS
jgi:hypothetical protein